jgi:hypothetical protein
VRALPPLGAAAFELLHVCGCRRPAFSDDSCRYAREAYEFPGDSARAATRKAVAAYCEDTADWPTATGTVRTSSSG